MKLNFWQQYPLVKDDLQIVNQLIAKRSKSTILNLKELSYRWQITGKISPASLVIALFQRKCAYDCR